MIKKGDTLIAYDCQRDGNKFAEVIKVMNTGVKATLFNDCYGDAEGVQFISNEELKNYGIEGKLRNLKVKEMKTLKPIISNNSWSYIVNENGNAIRITCEGYGSCTPVNVLQEMINSMTPEKFKKTWNECEERKDVIN